MEEKMKNKTVRDLTHIAIVAALYVVLTIVPPFNLISYGPYPVSYTHLTLPTICSV